MPGSACSAVTCMGACGQYTGTVQVVSMKRITVPAQQGRPILWRHQSSTWRIRAQVSSRQTVYCSCLRPDMGQMHIPLTQL
jgi:hypothetical protein